MNWKKRLFVTLVLIVVLFLIDVATPHSCNKATFTNVDTGVTIVEEMPCDPSYGYPISFWSFSDIPTLPSPLLFLINVGIVYFSVYVIEKVVKLIKKTPSENSKE